MVVLVLIQKQISSLLLILFGLGRRQKKIVDIEDKLGHESYFILFLETQIQHKIWLEAHSDFKLQFHVIMGRVQQKVQFSHFFSGKMQILKGNHEFMKLWHLCLTHTHLSWFTTIEYEYGDFSVQNFSLILMEEIRRPLCSQVNLSFIGPDISAKEWLIA